MTIRSGQLDVGTTEGQLVAVGAGDTIPSSVIPAGNDVAALQGTVAHGGTIPLPGGYTQGQCAWFLSWGDGSGYVNPIGPYDGVRNYDNGSRLVTTQHRLESQGATWFNMTYSNYLIVGIKAGT